MFVQEYELWLIHNNKYGFLHRNYKRRLCLILPYMKKISYHFVNTNDNEFEYVLLEKYEDKENLHRGFFEWIDVLNENKLIVNRESMMTKPIGVSNLIRPRMTKRTTKMDYIMKGIHFERGRFTISFK